MNYNFRANLGIQMAQQSSHLLSHIDHSLNHSQPHSWYFIKFGHLMLGTRFPNSVNTCYKAYNYNVKSLSVLLLNIPRNTHLSATKGCCFRQERDKRDTCVSLIII